jgi:hypothetical protein
MHSRAEYEARRETSVFADVVAMVSIETRLRLSRGSSFVTGNFFQCCVKVAFGSVDAR